MVVVPLAALSMAEQSWLLSFSMQEKVGRVCNISKCTWKKHAELFFQKLGWFSLRIYALLFSKRTCH